VAASADAKPRASSGRTNVASARPTATRDSPAGTVFARSPAATATATRAEASNDTYETRGSKDATSEYSPSPTIATVAPTSSSRITNHAASRFAARSNVQLTWNSETGSRVKSAWRPYHTA
jgi:hypothetical protein